MSRTLGGGCLNHFIRSLGWDVLGGKHTDHHGIVSRSSVCLFVALSFAKRRAVWFQCGYLDGLRSSLGGWTQKVKSWYWGRPLVSLLSPGGLFLHFGIQCTPSLVERFYSLASVMFYVVFLMRASISCKPRLFETLIVGWYTTLWISYFSVSIVRSFI